MNPLENLFFLTLLYFSTFTGYATLGKAIIIMGASCSGKSTLSNKLLKSLGNQWKLVELDLIEDEFKALGKDTSDISLLDAVVAQSNTLLAAGWNIIIDTNIYHEILRTISTDDKKFVLVHCPINILLERNVQRDVILQRSAQRAARARKYVEETFYNFENFDKYDLYVDSSKTITSFDGIIIMLILKKVFENLGIEVSTLQEANAYAQQNLLLSEEQWHAYEATDIRKRLHANQQALLHELTALHMIDEIIPTKQKYAYALVMGSFKDDVTQRLDFLAKLLEQGYRFEHLVLLGGERPLCAFETDGLPDALTTEMQMMQYLFQQYSIFKNQQIIPVNEPMIQKSDGTLTRPTTDSTLIYFAQTAPKAGSCLVISNNPYIPRQTKVAQRILNQVNFPTEGAGPAFKGDIDIVMVMDEFARRLYEECKQLQNTISF